MLPIDGVFEQIAAVLAVCVVAGILATLLRQPLIVGLLAAGIAVGPDVLGLVEASDEIELLAEIGISLLLFVVGLKLDVRLIRKLGPVAAITGLAQIALTAVIGFALAVALGFDSGSAMYIAVALTFSSTIIIVKLLTDKRELDQLHGRIALGILIVQDITVVLALIVITAIGDGSGDLGGEFLRVAVNGAGLIVGVGLMARYVLPRAVHRLARNGELLVLASVTWAVALAAVSVVLGFSEEVGAFLAGVALASSPYREAISGRLTTLRDFLLVFFFIDLGTNLQLASAMTQAVPAVALAVFVLIAKPAIVMSIMGLLGYRKQVSFRAGITLAQISEFSLIFIALGAGLGQVGEDVVGAGHRCGPDHDRRVDVPDLRLRPAVSAVGGRPVDLRAAGTGQELRGRGPRGRSRLHRDRPRSLRTHRGEGADGARRRRHGSRLRPAQRAGR
ncbi:hypothetical protein BH23ACT9_BH23ACT9_21400 [soil metagenome]